MCNLYDRVAVEKWEYYWNYSTLTVVRSIINVTKLLFRKLDVSVSTELGQYLTWHQTLISTPGCLKEDPVSACQCVGETERVWGWRESNKHFRWQQTTPTVWLWLRLWLPPLVMLRVWARDWRPSSRSGASSQSFSSCWASISPRIRAQGRTCTMVRLNSQRINLDKRWQSFTLIRGKFCMVITSNVGWGRR